MRAFDVAMQPQSPQTLDVGVTAFTRPYTRLLGGAVKCSHSRHALTRRLYVASSTGVNAVTAHRHNERDASRMSFDELCAAGKVPVRGRSANREALAPIAGGREIKCWSTAGASRAASRRRP